MDMCVVAMQKHMESEKDQQLTPQVIQQYLIQLFQLHYVGNGASNFGECCENCLS